MKAALGIVLFSLSFNVSAATKSLYTFNSTDYQIRFVQTKDHSCVALSKTSNNIVLHPKQDRGPDFHIEEEGGGCSVTVLGYASYLVIGLQYCKAGTPNCSQWKTVDKCRVDVIGGDTYTAQKSLNAVPGKGGLPSFQWCGAGD